MTTDRPLLDLRIYNMVGVRDHCIVAAALRQHWAECGPYDLTANPDFNPAFKVHQRRAVNRLPPQTIRLIPDYHPSDIAGYLSVGIDEASMLGANTSFEGACAHLRTPLWFYLVDPQTLVVQEMGAVERARQAQARARACRSLQRSIALSREMGIPR